MNKRTKIVLQELDPKAKYIMLCSVLDFDARDLMHFQFPDGINPHNFAICLVENPERAIRFVKIPNNDKK